MPSRGLKLEYDFSMHTLLLHHTYLAILLVLFCEDLGIPLPIPADMVILYTGYRIRQQTLNPVFAPFLILFAINGGATLLYLIAQRGGRPLVDRFGRYIGLSPDRMARAEEWLRRGGFWGIVASRSIPGVRLATVIACALLHVPARRFLSAQALGIAIYSGFFLLLGYFAGPEVASRIHLPALSGRLIGAGALAVALPLLLHHLVSAKPASADLPRRHSIPLGIFLGLVEMALICSLTVGLLRLVHPMAGAVWPPHGSSVELLLLGVALGVAPGIYVGLRTARLSF